MWAKRRKMLQQHCVRMLHGIESPSADQRSGMVTSGREKTATFIRPVDFLIQSRDLDQRHLTH